MLDKRHNRGFTMVETIVVVAIMVILMGLAFVAVQNYQRTMKQLELDKTARELFVAAQNHLTVAESQGLLSTRDQRDAVIVGEQHARGGETYRYFFVGSDHTQLDNTHSVLHDMLPMFSIDDTVRLGGSYAIEYSLESATVTNVFYSDMSNLSSHEFTSADYSQLFVDPDYVGTQDAKKTLRLNGLDGNRNAIIGWYGGEDVKGISRVTLYAPKVQIINAEKLEVKVSFTRDAINRMLADSDTNAQVSVILEGVTSGNRRIVNLEPGKQNGSTVSYFNVDTATYNEVEGVVAYRCHNFVLDDVTSEDGHFANQWCTGEDPLIPGEDIVVRVKVFSNSVLANIPERVAGPTNSLFASVDESEAGIDNFRHLENLDPQISGYDLVALENNGAVPATKAKQLQDLAWDDFKEKIYSSDSNSVCIVDLWGEASHAGTYTPVNPSYKAGADTVHYLERYDGNGCYIAGVTINNASDAGLFGMLSDCEVKGLELRDFNVLTSNGNAGALVGSGDELTISKVVVRNTVADDSSYQIKGSGSVGGLVGAMGSSTIEDSAAATYVQSTDGCAGGLVGQSTGASKIEKSYTGGHTIDGAYLHETTANEAGRINIQAEVEAGGLVGKASGELAIDGCYSTCSSYGVTVGGLVGSMHGGEISRSYATGLVDGRNDEATLGAFAGLLSNVSLGQAEGRKNHYFSLVNLYDATDAQRTVFAIGNDEESTAVDAIDAQASAYDAFVAGTCAASPYDAYLKQKSDKRYPFKGIKDLSGSSLLSTHYGDWPMLEVLFVNAKE